MRKNLFTAGALLAAAVLALPPVLAQEADPSAQAKVGASTFREYCRSCHGSEGKGDGSVGKYLDPKPADLTRISERNKGEFPAEQVQAAIAGGKSIKGHGDSEMPIWGNAFREVRGGQTEEQVNERIANLVQFLKSIQVTPAAEAQKP
jgi:mono/diheme cytochrome c family protein